MNARIPCIEESSERLLHNFASLHQTSTARVFDTTINQRAVLVSIRRADNSIPMYICRYPDGKTRARFYSEIIILQHDYQPDSEVMQ